MPTTGFAFARASRKYYHLANSFLRVQKSLSHASYDITHDLEGFCDSNMELRLKVVITVQKQQFGSHMTPLCGP